MSEDAVSASAKGASFLILLQMSSRALTFVLNQVLLRFLSPEQLGASVQLELFKIGTMYFSRESLRVATERRSDGGVQAAINLSYLAVAAGLPIGLISAHWYLSMAYPDVPYFVEALRVNELAAMVELCMEPAFVAVQQNMLFKSRAAAEGLSFVLKTVTVASFVFWSRHKGVDLGVLPFAAGELVNSVALLMVYWILTIPVARERSFSLFPKRMRSSPENPYVFSLFSTPLLYLLRSLFFQLGIKWVLTEGDKILIGILASLEDQGMYAVSANYGGLIARMIFQPIETSSRNLFANLCTTPSQAPNAANGTAEADKDKVTKKNIERAATILRDILRVYSIVSLIALAIGPSAAPLLLRLVAGARWSESGAGEVLGTYCYYIPFLAINGVSEAFVAATASTNDLQHQTVWMLYFSAFFAGSAYFFLRVLGLGAQGLVLANCVNMGLRIMFNMRFVKRFFRERGLDFNTTEILPNAYASAAVAVVISLLAQSQKLSVLQPYGLLGELVRVGAIGVVFTAIVATSEKNFLLDCYTRFRS